MSKKLIMSKRILAFAIVFILALSSVFYVSAEGSVPASLEKPKDVMVRSEYGAEFRFRWSNPESILKIVEDAESLGYDGELSYLIDWKKNDGAWNIAVPFDDPNYVDDINGPFTGYMGNVMYDEDGVSEAFFVTWYIEPSALPDTPFDLKNNTYYFRIRYVFEPYDEGYQDLYSPYSEVTAIGKGAATIAVTKLDPPKDLKVEVKKDSDNKPYFQLNWVIPESIIAANKQLPVYHIIDFKVDDGKWLSETTTWDWMPSAGSGLMASYDTFDPVEKQLVDKVVIEENTYYFRVLYMCEPTEGNRIASVYSNVASTKVDAYSNVSEVLKPEVDDADQKGLIPDSLRGTDMTKPITREEFAACAVKFYEMVTGKDAVPHPTKTFKDCTNPEVLKAFNLGITSGVGDGTRFEPNAYLLRQQMAAMITRTLSACFEDIAFNVEGVPDFNDQKLILKYANVPVKFMAKYKITVGNGKGSFNPNGNCTREQALAFLIRSYNYRDQYMLE